MDFLRQIAIEKVRRDFGDLTCCIFLIILKNNGVNLVQLNHIIPGIKYKMLRAVIFRMYRFSLIEVRIEKETNQDIIEHYLNGIRFYPNITNCLLRIRASKLLAVVELEYGFIGGILFSYILKNGSSSYKSLKEILYGSKKRTEKWEDIYIQMVRDNILINNFNLQKTKALIKNNPVLNISKYIKPHFFDIFSTWSIGFEIIDSMLNLGLGFSILRSYCGVNFTPLFRSIFSRTFSLNGIFSSRFFLSLDSLNDYNRDISGTMENDDLKIWLIIQHLMDISFFLNLQKNFIRFDTSSIKKLLKKTVVEKFVTLKYGRNLERLLLGFFFTPKRLPFWDYNTDSSKMNISFLEFYRLGLIKIMNNSKPSDLGGNVNMLSAKADNKSVITRIINDLAKTIFNLFIRQDHFISIIRKFLLFSNKNFPKNITNDIVFSQLKIITLSITKFDTLLHLIISIC